MGYRSPSPARSTHHGPLPHSLPHSIGISSTLSNTFQPLPSPKSGPGGSFCAPPPPSCAIDASRSTNASTPLLPTPFGSPQLPPMVVSTHSSKSSTGSSFCMGVCRPVPSPRELLDAGAAQPSRITPLHPLPLLFCSQHAEPCGLFLFLFCIYLRLIKYIRLH